MVKHTMALRPIQQTDLPMFQRWLALPHVAKWYTQPQDWLYELEHRNDEFQWVNHFIVEYGDRSIGFCQFYEYRLSGETWHGTLLLEGAYSIDYLIGETDYLNKGYGKQIVLELIRRIRQQAGATRVFVQPEPENAASCHTLLSAGFRFDSVNGAYLLDL